MDKQISAIVFVFNEERHLSECLKSLSFCDEILVFEMGSSDNSRIIAERMASRVISIPLVDFPEQVLSNLVKNAKNDWIISQDPDEVMTVELGKEIIQIVQTKTKIAKILTPRHFYFRGKVLTSTIWSGEKYKDRVFNRTRVKINQNVHQEIDVRDGFESYKIPFTEEKSIKHYWVDSIPEMFQKHWRYLKYEGEALYEQRVRFTIKSMLSVTYRALVDNLGKYHGIKDGPRGIFLSFFYAWYVGMSQLSLMHYQIFEARKKSKKKNALPNEN